MQQTEKQWIRELGHHAAKENQRSRGVGHNNNAAIVKQWNRELSDTSHFNVLSTLHILPTFTDSAIHSAYFTCSAHFTHSAQATDSAHFTPSAHFYIIQHSLNSLYIFTPFSTLYIFCAVYNYVLPTFTHSANFTHSAHFTHPANLTHSANMTYSAHFTYFAHFTHSAHFTRSSQATCSAHFTHSVQSISYVMQFSATPTIRILTLCTLCAFYTLYAYYTHSHTVHTAYA